MGLLNGMKDKLGFGNKPEWEDDDNYDDGYDDRGGYAGDGYEDDGYADDGYADESDGYGSTSGDVISFDAYNPDNFENVTLSSDRAPRVASSYDSLGSSSSAAASSYAGPRSGSYSRNIGTSASRRSDRPRSSSAESPASWSNPADPSFLDNTTPSYSRSSSHSSSDPYSSLGSEFIKMHGDPATHLSVIRPKAYADVEKIANAAKAGKSVVLVVSDTKPALAKRILDFSFGVASGLNLNVDKAADRVFVVSKGSEMLSDEERDYLKEKGILS